jgi:hypothetical protein
LDAHLDDVAITAVPLILHPRTWIDRRREYVEFLDEQTLRREVRIDFTVPECRRPLTLTPSKGVFYAPLALIAKGSLRQLRVDDGSGAELAPVNRRDAGRLACRILTLAAGGIVGHEPSPVLQTHLEQLATDEPGRALDVLRRIGKLDGQPGEEASALLSHSRFKILIGEFAQSSLFLLPLVGLDAHERSSVRYVYEECVRPSARRRRRERVAESIGWNAVDFTFDTPALGNAMSCDLDIKAPEELRIESARILEDGREDAELDDDPRPTRIAHLRVQDCARGTDGIVRVGLRLRSGGFLGSCVIAAALTVAVLVLGVARSGAVAQAGESAAALLVGLPALLAGYLVRPGEHRLVGRVVNGIRLLLVVLVLLCVIAIGTLIGQMDQTAREWVWGGMAVVAFGIFVVTALAWARAHKLER